MQTLASGLRNPVDLRFAVDGSLYILLRNAWVMDSKFPAGTAACCGFRGASRESRAYVALSEVALRFDGSTNLLHLSTKSLVRWLLALSVFMTSAFLFVAVLLVLGTALRLRIRLFRKLYIPASVIAGGLGLLAVQFSGNLIVPTIVKWAPTAASLAGWLIAVVFAGMLLERSPPWRESLSRVGRQGLMVWVIVSGQTAVGLLVTWLLIQPFNDVPNSLGMLIETGFAGGHGTAAAMGQVFAHPTIDLQGGLDLGILMATCGLVYGIVSGILWINLGVRRGWVEQRRTTDETSDPNALIGNPIGYAQSE